MPLFGLISDLPVKDLAERQKNLDAAASKLGIPFPNPFLSLVALTGSAIPFLRICEEGLVHFKDGITRNLII
jgi:adenine deaminase